MRRGLYVIALSLTLYAMTLVLGYFGICRATDALAEWATQGCVARAD